MAVRKSSIEPSRQSQQQKIMLASEKLGAKLYLGTSTHMPAKKAGLHMVMGINELKQHHSRRWVSKLPTQIGHSYFNK